MIAVILVIIALIAFMALGIFIALIVCQNKKRYLYLCSYIHANYIRMYFFLLRNPKIHWSRDEDIKYVSFHQQLCSFS